MKRIVFFLALMTVFDSHGGTQKGMSMNDVNGKKLEMSDFSGKPYMLVNIATQCGYTPQLKGLESLYQKYKKLGFSIIGVPSNDFGGQTPEKNLEVKKFCELRYGVTFPMTSKTVVKGANKHPFIQKLINDSGDKKEIAWNFEKFLVDGSGKVVGRFSSAEEPNSKTIDSLVKKLLSVTSK